MVPAPLPAPHAAKHGVAIASITASRDHISITASDPATLDYLRENVHTRLDDRLPAHLFQLEQHDVGRLVLKASGWKIEDWITIDAVLEMVEELGYRFMKEEYLGWTYARSNPA